MVEAVNHERDSWKTKPTDRFVLKWIKVHLSARITPKLVKFPWLRPWMITISSTGLGGIAGVVFAMGCGWLAGLVGGIAQILDGVDGQFARLTGRQSAAGAFWDSVLDRYADGAMMIGLVVYLVGLPAPLAPWVLLLLGSVALIGSGLISYSSARAENLGLNMGKPTLASKGTRMTMMVLAALGSAIWPWLPLIALLYLAAHSNVVVIRRLIIAHRSSSMTG
jgi:phosphatidylglycerophosphate synthase